MVESASRVLQGTNLSIYGEGGQLLGQLAPLFDYLARSLRTATQAPIAPDEETGDPAPAEVAP